MVRSLLKSPGHLTIELIIPVLSRCNQVTMTTSHGWMTSNSVCTRILCIWLCDSVCGRLGAQPWLINMHITWTIPGQSLQVNKVIKCTSS